MEINLKQVQRRCGQKLRELELPEPFDVRTFCDLLATRRGRPIIPRAVATGGGLSGAWVAAPSADVIFFEGKTSRLHQEQIILHEACHIIWGHKPIQLSEADVARLLFPELEPEIAQRMLQRAGYSSQEECEAELLASMILENAAGPVSPSVGSSCEEDRVLHRLEASLEDGGGAR